MAKTPMNAAEYLKSLLGMAVIPAVSFVHHQSWFRLDFASDRIPSAKHNDTPRKFMKTC